MTRLIGTADQRFDAKYVVNELTGCWIWIGSRRGRYGCHLVNRVGVTAHRYSYERHRGPIPAGHVVCHTCDTPLCVNPSHLFTGTQADNMADSSNKGRSPVGTRHPKALPAETVTAIRATTGPQRDVAAEFGVSSSTVNRLRRGHRHADSWDR